MSGRLQGKRIIVTGAGSGMGRSSVLLFTSEGADVVGVDIDEASVLAAVGEAAGARGKAFALVADVASSEQVARMVEESVSLLGGLDGAFNNAGIGCAPALLAEQEEAAWDRLLDVDLKSVWLCMKYEVPHLVAGGGGSIVNTASVEGLVAMAGIAPYVAAKSGVVGLTRAAALEYAAAGIRVNAICPGTIRTPLVEQWLQEHPEVEEAWIEISPMKRMGLPHEIAEAALWLLSDWSSFVTGHPLPVDGGALAQ